jgi:rubrerythrin
MVIWRSTSPATLGRLLTLMARDRRPASGPVRKAPRAVPLPPRRAAEPLSSPPPPPPSMDFNQRPTITDCKALYSLAAAQEREAERQYRTLAATFRKQGDGLRAALFRRLADFEAEHLDQIRSWAIEAGPGADGPPPFRWDDILAERPSHRLADLGPLQALHHCIHNEERAYALYRDIAAATPDAAVRDHAERLASEELEHLLTLRQEERWLRPKIQPAHRDTAVDDQRWTALLVHAETDCGRRHRAAAVTMRRWGLPDLANLFQDLSEDAEAALRAQGRAVIFTGSGQIEPPGPRHLMQSEAAHMLGVFDTLQYGCHLAANDSLAHRARADTARAVARLARIRDASTRVLGAACD